MRTPTFNRRHRRDRASLPVLVVAAFAGGRLTRHLKGDRS